jgi:hypothetical protein
MFQRQLIFLIADVQFPVYHVLCVIIVVSLICIHIITEQTLYALEGKFRNLGSVFVFFTEYGNLEIEWEKHNYYVVVLHCATLNRGKKPLHCVILEGSRTAPTS